ncbi:hypothetical protein TWF730_003783 [Orbilia blumenaviensis]|uniref:Uncharacterized protein n=1 Tax=Orbilia blumenaviensis TaxID=1796055 RepID=A0AAV9U4J5_9PEZI
MAQTKGSSQPFCCTAFANVVVPFLSNYSTKCAGCVVEKGPELASLFIRTGFCLKHQRYRLEGRHIASEFQRLVDDGKINTDPAVEHPLAACVSCFLPLQVCNSRCGSWWGVFISSLAGYLVYQADKSERAPEKRVIDLTGSDCLFRLRGGHLLLWRIVNSHLGCEEKKYNLPGTLPKDNPSHIEGARILPKDLEQLPDKAAGLEESTHESAPKAHPSGGPTPSRPTSGRPTSAGSVSGGSVSSGPILGLKAQNLPQPAKSLPPLQVFGKENEDIRKSSSKRPLSPESRETKQFDAKKYYPRYSKMKAEGKLPSRPMVSPKSLTTSLAQPSDSCNNRTEMLYPNYCRLKAEGKVPDRRAVLGRLAAQNQALQPGKRQLSNAKDSAQSI